MLFRNRIEFKFNLFEIIQTSIIFLFKKEKILQPS